MEDTRLCVNCLQDSHSVIICKHQFSCSTCQRRHHSLLHRPAEQTEVHQSFNKESSYKTTVLSSNSTQLTLQQPTETGTKPPTSDIPEVAILNSSLNQYKNESKCSELSTLIVKATDSMEHNQTINRALLNSATNFTTARATDIPTYLKPVIMKKLKSKFQPLQDLELANQSKFKNIIYRKSNIVISINPFCSTSSLQILLDGDDDITINQFRGSAQSPKEKLLLGKEQFYKDSPHKPNDQGCCGSSPTHNES